MTLVYTPTPAALPLASRRAVRRTLMTCAALALLAFAAHHSPEVRQVLVGLFAAGFAWAAALLLLSPLSGVSPQG